jgi:bisanhydrobacterioruberin hydratase
MAILFGGGILAHSLAPLRGLALAITTPLLLLTNAAVLWAIFDEVRLPRLYWWCLGAWFVTLTLEMVGVATGLIFGDYHYGATLRGQVAGVPLLIGLNWVALLLGAIALIEHHWWNSEHPFTRSNALLPAFLKAIGAALLLTGFDWVMEPVAVALDYWQWATWPLIPWRNYGAWFFIAFVLAFLFGSLRIRLSTGMARYYFVIQLLFFAALRFVL